MALALYGKVDKKFIGVGMTTKSSPEALAIDEAKRNLEIAIDVLGVNYVRWYIEQYLERKKTETKNK